MLVFMFPVLISFCILYRRTMLRQLVNRVSRQIQPQKVCHCCASRHLISESSQWKLATAVCLERYPVITQEMNDLEKRFQTLMEEYDVENSLISEHEEQIRLDAILAQMKKEREERDEVDEVNKEAATVTALDKEDEWESELNDYQHLQNRVTGMLKFKFNFHVKLHISPHWGKWMTAVTNGHPEIGDGNSEADKQNDMKSIRRKLDRKLILIIQKNLNGKLTWFLPQGFYQEEESLKQAAENVLSQNFGDSIKSGIVGNAPHGVYQYHLPKTMTDECGATGVKVFIYRAELMEGNVEISDKDITDYKWVTLDELSDYLTPKYQKNIRKFVLEI